MFYLVYPNPNLRNTQHLVDETYILAAFRVKPQKVDILVAKHIHDAQRCLLGCLLHEVYFHLALLGELYSVPLHLLLDQLVHVH